MKDMPENDCPDCGFELCPKCDAEFERQIRKLNPPREVHALMRVLEHEKKIEPLRAALTEIAALPDDWDAAADESPEFHGSKRGCAAQLRAILEKYDA